MQICHIIAIVFSHQHGIKELNWGVRFLENSFQKQVLEPVQCEVNLRVSPEISYTATPNTLHKFPLFCPCCVLGFPFPQRKPYSTRYLEPVQFEADLPWSPCKLFRHVKCCSRLSICHFMQHEIIEDSCGLPFPEDFLQDQVLGTCHIEGGCWFQLRRPHTFHIFLSFNPTIKSGWWFGTFFIFPYIGNDME